MTTTFYCFPDEATGIAALSAAGLLHDDGRPIVASHTHALDVVGTIYEPGVYDPETDNEIKSPVPIDGWRVNYIGVEPPGWDQYQEHPVQPKRVFAE